MHTSDVLLIRKFFLAVLLQTWLKNVFDVFLLASYWSAVLETFHPPFELPSYWAEDFVKSTL
jgi:hypothetical protein